MPKKIIPGFYFIGNHPVLDFVNTKIAVKGQPLDLLKTLADLLDWLRQVSFITLEEVKLYEQKWGDTVQGIKVLESAAELRSYLLTIIEKRKIGEKAPEASIQFINQLVKQNAVISELVQNDDGFIREKKHVMFQKPLDLLVPVAEAAIDFFVTHDLALVKKCENPACVLYFYDNSKNNTRRWCSPKTCGNRMKVAAYLERQQNQLNK